MKVLMTSDTIGGVWNYSMELIRQLETHDVQVVLATMGGRLRPDQRAQADALANAEVIESEYKLCWMADPWDDVAASGTWLRRLAVEHQPDVVHSNDFPHGSLPWDCPVLMVGHSCVLSWFEAVRGHAADASWDRYRREVASGLQAVDQVVAPTHAMLQSLQRFYGPLPPCRVIPNGTDNELYRPGPKEPWVLSAGRLWDDAKNVGEVARAAPSLRWKVAIAGDCQHPDGGEIAIGDVQLLGQLGTADLAQWYARSAIYALPARYEPFGLSILEAALSGCALVLGDIASLREIWGDAASFVPPDDDRALAAAIHRLIEHEDERAELVRRSRQRASTLTACEMASRYAACYHTLTDTHALALSSVPPCDA